MSKLDELKSFIKQQFIDAAKSKEEVDSAAKLSNLCDEVEKENAKLVEKNAELLNAYKEVIKDSTGNTNKQEIDKTIDPETPTEDTSLDSIFDTKLAEYESTHPDSHVDSNKI